MTTLDQARTVSQQVLTDEEITNVVEPLIYRSSSDYEVARAIEAAVLEKLGKVDVEPDTNKRKAERLVRMLTDGYSGMKAVREVIALLEQWPESPASTLAALRAENERLRKALEWIDRRCPEQFLKQEPHRIHWEAAYDAGACARAALQAKDAA